MIDHDILTFLRPGQFVDSDHSSIHGLANRTIFGATTAVDRAVALYYAVRDEVRYDVYVDYTDPTSFRASGVLAAGRWFCLGKAAVLTACCRAVGIPARLGYADVRNHVTSPRLKALIQSDVFLRHSFAELFLLDRWVKAAPAFDRPLCERAGLMPPEFDGRADSLFQPFDTQGRRRMEYLVWRGSFADVPFEAILSDFRLHYPSMISDMHGIGEDFRKAVTTTAG